jgi:hypothetical protein
MIPTYVIVAVFIILIAAVLAIVLIAWNVKTQPMVQRFISGDLKKRAFVVRQNEGGFKVIYQRYSNEVINVRGDVAGWQALPEKPVTESLANAVEIAQSWAHAED